MTVSVEAGPVRASGLKLPGRPGTVIFDLDGTLTDPKPGITRSVQYALETMGRPVPEADALEWMIGPPLRQSFAVLLGEDHADEAVRLYRERYATVGLFENEVIPGIPALLAALQAEGRRLLVATSKPRVFADRILVHFELSARFEAIHGSEFDGTNTDKRDLLRAVVAAHALAPSDCVMIGDREHDVIGGASVGIATVGVRWGYGTLAELTASGAAAIVETPAELAVILGVARPLAGD